MSAPVSQRSITSFDILLVALILSTLGFLAYFVYSANPPAHQRYSRALLEFSLVDGKLTEDLYRMDAGELNNFDPLVSDMRLLVTHEYTLAQLPSTTAGNPALHDALAQLRKALHEKLGRLEDFKSSWATMRAMMDSLPANGDAVLRSSAGAAVPSSAVTGLLERIYVFLDEPNATNQEFLKEELDRLTALAGTPVAGEPRTALQQFTHMASLVVRHKERSVHELERISAIPVRTAAAHLTDTYLSAYQAKRYQSAWIVALFMGALLLTFVAITYVTQWRTARREAVVAEQQGALKEAIKEARIQTATLRRGEVSDATLLAEERMAALLCHTFEIAAIVSREEHFIFLSPAVETVLGIPEKELIGKSVYEGIHADDLIRVKDYLTRAQKELQTEQSIRYRVMDAFGKWHVVETFASNHYSNPAIRGLVLNTRPLDGAPAAVDVATLQTPGFDG